MSNSGSGKVEITGVSVSNAIGKLKLSGKSGSVGYAVGEGSGSYAVSYDAADGCKFSSTLNRPLGIESGKTLSWNWNIGKLNASDHRAALDSAASGRARLCDMSFSYASVGNSLSSVGTTGSISGAVNSQSSSVLPVGGTATANVGNVPANASLSYQWYTVDSNGSYSAIANANGKTLKILAAYRGKDIVCRVSDSSGHYSGYVETVRKPVRNLAPKVGISGSSVYGGKLTASVSGLPSGTTYTYKYKWQRLSGSSWVDIANATAAEYTLGGEDVGKQVRVIVSTASNIYTVDDVTAVSATVAKAKASIGVSISGTKNNSSKLTASVSGLPGSGANTVSYRWQRSSDGKSNWVDSTAGDAKSNSIQMQPNDVSWHYHCIVSASNPYYDIASATSAAYGPIAKSTVSAAKATISGNAVYGGTIKANVTNVPTVGTNSISYQWQYSEDGKAWNDTRLNGGKASSLVLSAVSCVGTQYRCVISVDNSYYIVPGCTTNTVKVGKASVQAVAKASGEAVAGKELTVAVSGLPTVGGTNKVYYQWQFSNDGKTWGGSTLDGATTSTLHLYDSDNVAHNMVGFSYRCIVSVSGNSAYDIKSATSNVIGPVVKGTAAAPSVSVGGTKKVESTLKATVTGLPKYGNSKVSYQWQTSADGSKWVDSAQSDAKSVSFKPAYSLVNQYVRCAVSVSNDQYNVATGYSAAFGKLGKASKTISAAITSPNKRNGDTLTCGISGLASNGSNTIAYKWECARNSAFTSNVDGLDDRGNAHVTSVGTGTYYRCTVTASNPYYEYNTAVSPVYGPLAKGVASAPTVTVSGSNAWGSTLKATVTGLPKYGNSKVSYQWEARDDSSTAWGKSGYATATTDHITVDAQDAVSKARHYRCKVTVDNDQYTVPVAYSSDHGKTVKASATAKAAISGNAVIGGKLSCSVSGLPTSGSNSVSYQWQYSNDNKTWTDSNAAGAKSNAITTDTTWLNKYARCVITVSGNAYYNINGATSAAYGPIGKGSHAAPAVSVSGTKAYGYTLTANVSGQPNGTTATSYQWQRASRAMGAWSNISNATGKTYKLGTGDMNQYLRVLVGTTSTYYNVSQGVSAAYGAIGKASATVSATVSGTKNNTSKLTVSVGGLPSVGTNTVSYQWQWSNNGSTGWTNLTYSDGKSNAIQMKEADVAYYYRCIVTVSGNAYYNINGATSAAYGPIGKSSHSAPSVSVSGDKTVGATLTASVSGQPSGTTSTTYQWQRASSASGSYSNISGATGRTYKTVDADANKYVRVLVNTVNTYYAVSQGVSAGYGAILITGGEANLDYTEDEQAILKCTYNTALTITPIYQWYRNGQPIENATKNTYKLTEADCGKNIECHVSDGNQELKGYLSDNKNIPVLKTVNLDANGGKFSDGSTKHTIKYIQESELVIKYSHTDNIDDEGNATGTYKANLSTNDVVTIPGATKLTIDVWHATGVKLHDWLAIYPKGITPSSLNYLKATISNGKLGGSFATEKDSATHDTFEVNDDTAQFYFKSNKISEYYGYYAVVKGNCQINKIISGSNETYIPNYTGYRFDSWNTSIDGRGDKIDNILGNEDNITLYAKYEDMRSAFAVYCENDKSLNFYKRMNIPSVGDTFNGRAVTAVYTGIEKDSYDYTTRPWQQYQLDIITSTIVDDGIAPVSTAFWFYNCNKLTSVNNLNKLNTSKVTNMAFMFSSAYDLTSVGDLSKWDTSNVTNMGSMFNYCHRLTSVGDLSGWNTSNVTDMSKTFYYCEKLVSFGNISVWDTSKVINMMRMFSGCKSLNSLDLSKWNTSNVRKMNRMFEYCSSLTSLDLSKWDTSRVTDMDSMFYNCSKLSLNCSNWNVSKVINNNNFNTNAPGVIAPTWPSSDEIVDEDPIAPQSNELLEENQSKENTKQEKPNNVLTEQNSQTNNAIDNSNNLNNTSDTDNQTGDINTKSENVYEYHLAA